MSNIRKYINIVETAQQLNANISKIARYITRVTNHGTIIYLKNVNQNISVYNIPIPIDQFGIGWRSRSQNSAGYIEIELFYKGDRELIKKIVDAANTPEISYNLTVMNYLKANRHEILKVLDKINLGFSTAALEELATHCRVDIVIPDRDNFDRDPSMISFTYSTLQSEPQPQIMSELERALRYKKSMEELDK